MIWFWDRFLAGSFDFPLLFIHFHVSVVARMDIQFMKCYSGTEMCPYFGTTIEQKIL